LTQGSLVFLWFAAPTVVAVFAVFRDPSLDYRLVALGALVPDVVDGTFARRIAWLHSVVVIVSLLGLVMVISIGRRTWRKRMIALSIGLFGHLILDGAWLNADAFWWPFTPLSTKRIPLLDRPVGMLVVQELVGLALASYFVRRCKLSVPARCRLFLRTGTVDPRLVAPEANPLRRRRRSRGPS
jgi:hypothetical protein